jgi:hypothetical protein
MLLSLVWINQSLFSFKLTGFVCYTHFARSSVDT